MTEIEILRSENAAVGIGPQLAQLLSNIVRATAPTYPPGEYSDAGVWNRAALEDAMQDWIMKRLVERGDLAVMLASAGSVQTLRRMLTRSLSQHLINRRPRTSATNLFARTVRLLRSDSRFRMVGDSRRAGEQRWTLAAEPADQPADPGSVSALIKAAGMRSDAELGIVRYGPYSLKSSPVLRGPALREFITFLLTEASGYLTTAEIFQVMRHRFNLVDPALVALDESIIDREPLTPAKVEASMLARTVIAQLGQARGQIIRAVAAADGDPARAARDLGVRVSEVSAAIDMLCALIAQQAESGEQAAAIYRQVAESLFLEGEEQ